MAIKFSAQQKGVTDGSAVPAEKGDGRVLNANKSVLVASKPTTDIWANGDQIYLGKQPAGTVITDIKGLTDTSFGTSTLSIGDGGDPVQGGAPVNAASQVNAATLTAVDTPTELGPLAAIVAAGPVADEVDLWLTVGVADIAAAVDASIVIEFSGLS